MWPLDTAGAGSIFGSDFSSWLLAQSISPKGGHMTTRLKVGRTLCLLALCTFRLWGQGPPLPVPIPGGDVIPGFGLINQFLPGPGAGFDGLNADPQGINNSSGHVALGFTA